MLVVAVAFLCHILLLTCHARILLRGSSSPVSVFNTTSIEDSSYYNTTAWHDVSVSLPDEFIYSRPRYPYRVTYGNWRDPKFNRRNSSIFIDEALDDLDDFRVDQKAEWTDALPTDGYVFVNDTYEGGLEFAVIQKDGRQAPCKLTYEMVETVLYGLQKVFLFPVPGQKVTTNSFLMKIRQPKAWVYIAEGVFTGFHFSKKDHGIANIGEEAGNLTSLRSR